MAGLPHALTLVLPLLQATPQEPAPAPTVPLISRRAEVVLLGFGQARPAGRARRAGAAGTASVAGAAGGALRLASLALGDGGVKRVGGRPTNGRGFVRTPGGVLVRAKTAGAKLDFPSGRELLVSPDGRVHLRSGEATLPFFHGVRLQLADGAVVTVRRGASPQRPLASVEVSVGERTWRLWSGTRRAVNASHTGAFRGATVLALGDGGALYTASAAGPLLALERVLCAKSQAVRLPRRRLVVVGAVLARSMLRLPAHAPRKSVQFPQAKEAAVEFARLGALFDRTVPRPPGAVGEIWLPLRARYRLKVEARKDGVLVVGFYREGSGVPGLEWTIAGKTLLHFVRPDGGAQRRPRYFLRGLDLSDLIEELVPGAQTRSARARVQRVIEALGGRAPTKLEVRAR